MAGRNGLAALGVPRPVIKLRSDTITYTLEDEDGETVTLKGYKKGPGCPLPVLLDVDEALCVLDENEPTADERPTFPDDGPPVSGSIPIRRYVAKAEAAERTLRRMMLEAVIPGLTLEQANVLASDDGPWKDMLIELGWRQSDDAPVETDDDAGEAAGPAASTGRPDSPASVPPTPATTP